MWPVVNPLGASHEHRASKWTLFLNMNEQQSILGHLRKAFNMKEKVKENKREKVLNKNMKMRFLPPKFREQERIKFREQERILGN